MRKAAKHYGETHQALEQSDKLINWRIKEKED
jgi:hypothetical protein